MAKILVVDDEATVQRTYRLFLSKAGHEVLTAEDYEQAIPIVFKDKPDLLLIDVNLPFMQGDDFARLLFETLLNPPTILLLSGIDETLLAEKSVTVGAHGYIHKRSTPQEIIEQVKNFLANQSAG